MSPTFVTADYFVTRPRLWVSEEFKSRIASAYPEALVPRGLNGVESFDLDLSTSDNEIFAFPGMCGMENVCKHAFMPDQIGALIELQSNGDFGKLRADGVDNIFYVLGKCGRPLAVSVYYRTTFGWHVGASRFGDYFRDVGSRIFRNTQVLKA